MKLTDYLPVGYPVERMVQGVGILWAAMALGSLPYLYRLGDARSDLYFYRGTALEPTLIPDARMLDFHVILEGSFSVVPFFVGLFLAFMGSLYVYHFSESRSIYLMRRLPNRWELLRRCITLPLVGIGGMLILVCILFFVYYGLYFIFTPEAALTPDQWGKWLASWQ